jgi:hypothetical protein
LRPFLSPAKKDCFRKTFSQTQRAARRKPAGIIPARHDLTLFAFPENITIVGDGTSFAAC